MTVSEHRTKCDLLIPVPAHLFPSPFMFHCFRHLLSFPHESAFFGGGLLLYFYFIFCLSVFGSDFLFSFFFLLFVFVLFCPPLFAFFSVCILRTFFGDCWKRIRSSAWRWKPQSSTPGSQWKGRSSTTVLTRRDRQAAMTSRFVLY